MRFLAVVMLLASLGLAGCIFPLGAVFIAPVPAGEAQVRFFHGHDLYQMSNAYKNISPERCDDAIAAGKFMGFVAGVYDEVLGDKICKPKHVTVGLAADVVANYLESHPEIRYKGGAELVVEALQQAFPYPCK